jgi:hypothetical protein
VLVEEEVVMVKNVYNGIVELVMVNNVRSRGD